MKDVVKMRETEEKIKRAKEAQEKREREKKQKMERKKALVDINAGQKKINFNKIIANYPYPSTLN